MEFDDENIIINNIDDDVADTLLVTLLALISKVLITKWQPDFRMFLGK